MYGIEAVKDIFLADGTHHNMNILREETTVTKALIV